MRIYAKVACVGLIAIFFMSVSAPVLLSWFTQNEAPRAAEASAEEPSDYTVEASTTANQAYTQKARETDGLADTSKPSGALLCDPEVEALLDSLGLIKLAPVFAKEDVNMNALRLMTNDDLKECGVSVGARVLILAKAAGAHTSSHVYPTPGDVAFQTKNNYPPSGKRVAKSPLLSNTPDAAALALLSKRDAVATKRAILKAHTFLDVALQTKNYHPSFGERRTIECPAPPDGAKLARNATRLLFIGPHHTGTFSYNGMALDGYFGTNPAHNAKWTRDPAIIWEHDVLSDTPYVNVDEWNERMEFGHTKHPDLRMLFECFPNALFAINTRSLSSFVRSKVSWQTGRHGHPSEPCGGARKVIKGSPLDTTAAVTPAHPDLAHPSIDEYLAPMMCSTALVRERVYRRFLDFIAEDRAVRQPRFIATDITAEGFGPTAYRLCRFFGGKDVPVNKLDVSILMTQKMRSKLPLRCEDALRLENQNLHDSKSANKACETELMEATLMRDISSKDELRRANVDTRPQNPNKRAKIDRACDLLPQLGSESMGAVGLAFTDKAAQAHESLFMELLHRFAGGE